MDPAQGARRAPAVFVSHGSPMLPLEPGSAAPMLTELGAALRARTLRAVLVLSPHWMTRGLAVGSAARPQTLHDFGGFDPALQQLRYPAAGDPELARQVAGLLGEAGLPVALDPGRGLDHGVWVPLRLMFPRADLPVVPLSMPWPLDAQGAWRLGSLLAPLREQGVLLLGSGSLTHNLHEFRAAATVADPAEPYVLEFSAWMREAIGRGDAQALLEWKTRAPHARRAHPSDEHLLPLHWVLGAALAHGPVPGPAPGAAQGTPAIGSEPAAAARYWCGGVHYGMLSMDAWTLD